jgi:hypothetical protein
MNYKWLTSYDWGYAWKFGIGISISHGSKWHPKFNIAGAYIAPKFGGNGTGKHFTKNKRHGTPKAVRKVAELSRRVSLRR